MKNKSIIIAALSACIALSLCACSFTNDTNTEQSNQVTLCDVKDIYNNADKVVSKEYKRFRFSQGCRVEGSTDVYILKLRGDNPDGSSELVCQRGEALAKLYIGDKYDDKYASVSDDGKYCIYSYDDGKFSCNFDSVDSFQINDKYVSIPSGMTDYKEYDLKCCDLSQTLKIGEDTATLQEVYNINSELWNKKLSDYVGGLEITPRKVLSYTENEQALCKVLSTYNYKGIPIDYMSSPFVKIDKLSIGNYNKTSCNTIMKEKSDVFFASSLLRYTYDDSEPVDELISFEEAADMLDNELAEGTFYEFSGCELIYTNIAEVDQSDEIWDHDYDYTEKWEFVPTWCFYIRKENAVIDNANSCESFRIDARTGEIRAVFNETDW